MSPSDTDTRTTLVISFSGALNGLMGGRVTASDLEHAVFYLGCTREFTDDSEAWVQEIWGDRDGSWRALSADDAHKALMSALGRADANSRAAWRLPPDEPNTWEALNSLLESQGLPTITPVDSDWPQTGRYCYPSVVQAVHEQQPPYQVVS